MQGLPKGVRLVSLKSHRDDRGSLVELYRREWLGEANETVQWNHVISSPNVLRGIHVHHTHWDYLYMVQGTMELALVDIREGDEGIGQLVTLDAAKPQGVIIPPGVAHGFYFPKDAILVYGVSHYWNIDDELGCLWNDPALNIPWQFDDPKLSRRDRTAGSFAQMVQDFHTVQAHYPL